MCIYNVVLWKKICVFGVLHSQQVADVCFMQENASKGDAMPL